MKSQNVSTLVSVAHEPRRLISVCVAKDILKYIYIKKKIRFPKCEQIIRYLTLDSVWPNQA